MSIFILCLFARTVFASPELCDESILTLSAQLCVKFKINSEKIIKFCLNLRMNAALLNQIQGGKGLRKVAEHEKKDSSGVKGAGAVVGESSPGRIFILKYRLA